MATSSKRQDMKILLTNWELRKYGGSQLWTYTMNKALREMGHTVEVFSPKRGEFARNFDNVVTSPSKYDFAIVNQSIGIGKLDCPVISNCHSTFIPIENFRPGATKYVSVSKEIKDIQKIDSMVILNPVNHHQCTIKKPVNKKIKRVLYLNHDGGGISDMVKRAVNSIGAEMLTLTPSLDLSDQINEADVVIGIGRGLIEAMMCGRPVISVDKRSWMRKPVGYGIITPEFFLHAQEDNYSGRVNGKQYRTLDLIDDLVDLDLTTGEKLRELAVKHHNYHQIALKYAKLLN